MSNGNNLSGIIFSAIIVFAAPSAITASEVVLDADGTLHIQSLIIPSSDFVSAQFKEAYKRSAAAPMPQLPAKNAPKAEWDQYDAKYDRSILTFVDWYLEHDRVNVVDTEISGIRVGIITPKEGVPAKNKHRILINVHGGGFVVGRGLVQGQLESIAIASLGKMKVVTIDYRQAPYYSYPAASEDVETIYRELLKEYKPEAIGIFGGSAGGALTAQALAWFQAKGLPRPAAAGIFASGVPTRPLPSGGKMMGDSAMWGMGIPSSDVAAFAALRTPASWYMEGTDLDDTTAFPGSSDEVLAEFPPTLFLTGTRDLAMSPAITSHARLLKLGVYSSLYIIEGGWHGADLHAPGTPEERAAHTYVAQWFNRHLLKSATD